MDMSKIEIIPWSGCWIWMGGLTTNGYPAGYKHRKTLERKLGRRLGPLLARHTCDIKCCMNPAHLVEGTHADNMRDAVIRGQQVAGGRRFSAEQVLDIRAKKAAGLSTKQLAADYAVAPCTISRIVRRAMYASV